MLVEEDPSSGIMKLLNALETINGHTQLDKRGELRGHFYQSLQRKPLQRVSEFCSRFRTAVAELKMEGVDIPAPEFGWFLKETVGLDPLRKQLQLLETTLSGSEDYGQIESEILRLFKDIHTADLLYKTQLGPHRLFRPRPPSSASSSFTAGSSASSFENSSMPLARFTWSSASSSARSSVRASLSAPRQANVTEFEQDEGEDPLHQDEGAEAQIAEMGLFLGRPWLLNWIGGGGRGRRR